MNNKDSKYQTLMANLLNIDTYDTSLYTSINLSLIHISEPTRPY